MPKKSPRAPSPYALLHALIDELTELSDPQESAADLFVAFYRPQDTMRDGEASK